MNTSHLGFKLVTDHTELSALRTLARFTCEQCQATTEEFVASGQPLDPEGLAKRAARKGWLAEARSRGRTLCPRCKANKPKNDPDSEIKKVKQMTVTPIKPIAEVREPTTDQRVQIRNLLDKHFDDAKGKYLDGMSDQKVAEAANVPRAIVERMRETAYGPIRVDPEVAAIQALVAELGKQVDAAAEEHTKLRARQVALEERLGRLEKARAA
jgi:hypothetical protein